MSERKTYFVLCATTGRIKVGASADPERRVADLQVGSPTELGLVGTAPGHHESRIHREFSECRVHGEWFTPRPDFLDEVTRLTGWEWEGTRCELVHDRARTAVRVAEDRTFTERMNDRRLRAHNTFRDLRHKAGRLASAASRYVRGERRTSYRHRRGDLTFWCVSGTLKRDMKELTDELNRMADEANRNTAA